MPTFKGVRGTVNYREWLATDAVAGVVFLHGFGEHSGLYDRFALNLNARSVSLWALDQIGHGLTEGERGLVESLDDLVENGSRLTAVAEGRAPGLPLVIAGHSLGGVTSALTLARTPGRFAGAVLSGTPLSPLPWVLELHDSGEGELALDATDLSADPWYLDALENDPLAFTSAHVARTLGGTLPSAWAEIDASLRSVRRPILLVHGADDPIAPVADARVWVGQLHDARLAEFAGARHDVLNETVHADVAEAVADFAHEVSRDVRV